MYSCRGYVTAYSIVSHHDRDGLFDREHTGYSCMRAKERGARDWESYSCAAIYDTATVGMLYRFWEVTGHGSGLEIDCKNLRYVNLARPHAMLHAAPGHQSPQARDG